MLHETHGENWRVDRLTVPHNKLWYNHPALEASSCSLLPCLLDLQGAESIPRTSYHSWVKKTAGSPDPHPLSRTDPVISPLRTSSVNSLRGRPISQGGCPYMPSQRNPYLTKASARIITISSRHQGTTIRPHLRFVS